MLSKTQYETPEGAVVDLLVMKIDRDYDCWSITRTREQVEAGRRLFDALVDGDEVPDAATLASIDGVKRQFSTDDPLQAYRFLGGDERAQRMLCEVDHALGPDFHLEAS